MTDLRERFQGKPVPTVSTLEPSDPTCTARLHRSLTASRFYHCTCPESAAARDAFNTARRVPVKTCTATAHDTLPAYRDHGCICPPARAAWRKDRERRWRLGHKMRGGYDPRERWRGPQTRVDRWRMLLLRLGITDLETTRETQVGVWWYLGAPNRWGTGPMTNAEVADRVGTHLRAVDRAIVAREQLRAERTRRRHADAVWRAWHKHGQRW